MAKMKFFELQILEVIFLSVVFCFVSSQQACNPDEFVDGESLPTIPSTFFTRIECNMVEKKKSIEAHEFRVANETEDMLDINYFAAKDSHFDMERYILNVKKDESDLIGVGFGESGMCNHFGPESHPQNDFFGFESGDAEHLPGSGKVFTVAGAFKLAAKHKFKKIECEPVRGIPCVGYQTCIKLDGRQPPTNVDTIFFFSDKEKWIAADGMGIEVPLEIKVNWKEASGSDSSHVYEVTNFMESYVHNHEQAYFTPPPTIYCDNRKPKDPINWQAPEVYELDVEVINFQMGASGEFEKESIQEYRQYFDQRHKYDRFDFDGDPKKFGDVQLSQPMTVVHDFNTGHAYTIYRWKEECEITKLTVESGFDIAIANGQLTIYNPWSFLNDSADYSYQGIHYTRGIRSHVYVFPTEVSGDKMLISFYTSSGRVEDDESVIAEKHGPVHIRIKRLSTESKEEFPPTDMNIFDYQPTMPSLHAWNIGICFREPGQRLFLAFRLEGREPNWLIEPVRHIIYYEIMSKLHPAVQVAPIRIDNVRIADETLEDALVIAFELLEKPQVDGSENPDYPNVPLAEAYKNLKATYEDIEFEIPYILPDTGNQVQVKTMKPARGSLENIEADLEGLNGGESDGYSGGSMAGLGIGMLLLGGALSFGAVSFMQHRRRNMAGLPRM